MFDVLSQLRQLHANLCGMHVCTYAPSSCTFIIDGKEGMFVGCNRISICLVFDLLFYGLSHICITSVVMAMSLLLHALAFSLLSLAKPADRLTASFLSRQVCCRMIPGPCFDFKESERLIKTAQFRQSVFA